MFSCGTTDHQTKILPVLLNLHLYQEHVSPRLYSLEKPHKFSLSDHSMCSKCKISNEFDLIVLSSHLLCTYKWPLRSLNLMFLKMVDQFQVQAIYIQLLSCIDCYHFSLNISHSEKKKKEKKKLTHWNLMMFILVNWVINSDLFLTHWCLGEVAVIF